MKIVVTVVLVVIISEVAKRWSLLGAVLASLPVTSLLALTWHYLETNDRIKVADLSLSIFWVVIPSLVFFVSLFLLLRTTSWNFWVALTLSVVLTATSYFGYIKALGWVGVRL